MAEQIAPFILHPAQCPDISPVVFDSPHSGTILPDHFRYACQTRDLMFLHDPHVDLLLTDVPSAGVSVLTGTVHRSCIDLNRHEYEVNPDWIDGDWTPPHKMTFYTTSNAGLFPVMAGPRGSRIAAIYNDVARLTPDEGIRRIHDYHRPYYKELSAMLARAHTHHGFTLHINMHSSHRDNPNGHADIILGDLNEQSCAPDIVSFVTKFFKDTGYSVDKNGKYFSGGAIVQTTNNPANGIHSLQIEIARDLYMNQKTLSFSDRNGEKIRRDITRLASALNSYMLRRSAPGLSPA